ncbi:MAG: beta-lactamase family protein [Planctomyces sp.]|nr:beta-lactamase family protein [Planctomyces sp.]
MKSRLPRPAQMAIVLIGIGFLAIMLWELPVAGRSAIARLADDSQSLDKAKLDQFFDRLAEKNKAMGSLVIAKDGDVLYTRVIGFGQIDGVERKPLTPASRFRIASITKTYTAVMILQLVEEGKLKLTDPLDRFFPQIPNAQRITIGQLLAHRSGIPDVRRDQATWQPGAPVARDEMLAQIVKDTPDFEPDSRQAYSNAGYFVLGLILEQATGKSYAEALEERITSKIGLKDTYFATSSIDVSRNECLTYWNIGGEWQPGRESQPSVFEIVSTPGDMAEFVKALFELRLISQQSLDQMKTIRDGEGLGIVTFTFAGKTFYGNTGGGDNYGSWLAYEPEEKLAVAYTTNAKVYPVASIISGVVDICCNRPFEIPALESIVVSPEILDKYVGAYSVADVTAKAIISRDGSTLFFQPPGESTSVALEATSDDQFQIEGVAVFTFDSANGRLTVKRRRGERIFTKVK